MVVDLSDWIGISGEVRGWTWDQEYFFSRINFIMLPLFWMDINSKADWIIQQCISSEVDSNTYFQGKISPHYVETSRRAPGRDEEVCQLCSGWCIKLGLQLVLWVLLLIRTASATNVSWKTSGSPACPGASTWPNPTDRRPDGITQPVLPVQKNNTLPSLTPKRQKVQDDRKIQKSTIHWFW